MEPFTTIEEPAAPLEAANIDTDQIIPARFIQKPRANDFGQWLFLDVRRDAPGRRERDFVLDDASYAGARILVAGPNFGCGSSREHAVWALVDAGIRAVIAPSFGDIFQSNALKNGLLPVVLPQPQVRQLQAALRGQPGMRVCIDLRAQSVQAPGLRASFTIDSLSRECLLRGIDEIDYTLSQLASIEDHERKNPP